jgi:hypothetical protein
MDAQFLMPSLVSAMRGPVWLFNGRMERFGGASPLRSVQGLFTTDQNGERFEGLFDQRKSRDAAGFEISLGCIHVLFVAAESHINGLLRKFSRHLHNEGIPVSSVNMRTAMTVSMFGSFNTASIASR